MKAFQFIIGSGIIYFSDVNKFLWMVRIAGSTKKGRHINEMDYFSKAGEYRIDKEGSPIFLNCLLYKMSYYRFWEKYTSPSMLTSKLFCLISLCL